MHRGGVARGLVSRGGQGSIKSRLGFQAPRRNVGGGAVRGVGIVRGGGGRLGIKNRLGAGKGVAAVAIGEILDARQKINLNRVQTGRITDARQKIQEKRQKKAVLSGNIKNLKITANLREHNLRAEMMAPSPWTDRREMMMGQGGMSVGGQQDMRGRLSRLPPRSSLESSLPSRYTDSYSRDMKSAGGFRSGPELYSPPPTYHQSPMTMTRTVPIDRYHTMRIAPPSDDFMLTRTIRNPNAGYGGGHDLRSPNQGVAKVAPSIQYGSYNRSMSHDQPMDEDDDRVIMQQPRRIDTYSSSSESQHKILVSNLQQSVTADDIVELFSDIGQLVSARMTSSGHAEVTYAKKYDALKAIEAYHNRLLDGSAMRVFLETSSQSSAPSAPSGSSTGLKSASGASMKLPKSSSGIKIQPDISAIHKVLFNPGSSGTRGLFKGGQ